MTYCTWYYIYTGCYTLYLRNFHFTARPSERGWVHEKRRRAKRTSEEGGGEDEKTDTRENERGVNSIQPCQLKHIYIYPFLFGGRYRLVLVISVFGAESLLRKIVTITLRELQRRPREAWYEKDRYGGESGPRGQWRHENPDQQNLSRAHHGLVWTIEPWIQPADRRQNAGASSRSPAGRRLINGDKRDENGFDLSDERERD